MDQSVIKTAITSNHSTFNCNNTTNTNNNSNSNGVINHPNTSVNCNLQQISNNEENKKQGTRYEFYALNTPLLVCECFASLTAKPNLFFNLICNFYLLSFSRILSIFRVFKKSSPNGKVIFNICLSLPLVSNSFFF